MSRLQLIGCSAAQDFASSVRDAESLPAEVDLMEVRLDRYPDPDEVDLAALAAAIWRPAILTVRTAGQGGEFRRPARVRREILEQADAAGFAWIDLESDVAGEVRRGKARRILSWHGTGGEDGAEQVRALSAFDGDVIKVATMARSALSALRFVRSATDEGQRLGRKVVAICMGLEGKYLRPLAGKFDMPLLYAAIHGSRKTASGQITVKQALEVQRVHGVKPSTAVYAVAGADVRLSLSPRAHNQVFRTLERDAAYVDLSAAAFDDVAAIARELPLHGLSVTAPHKLAALAFADTLSGDAEEIGAVNTLVRGADGRFEGSNTDAPGFQAALNLGLQDPDACLEVALGRSLDCLRRLDSSEAAISACPPPAHALIYGYGGVVRAIAHGLLERGTKVCITGGLEAHGAPALAIALGRGAEAISSTRARSLTFDLLVKGVADEAWDSLPVDPFDFSNRGLAADVVMTPLETNFLLASRRAGRTVLPGIMMFSEQAVLQAVRFTGEPAEVVRPAICAGITAGISLSARRIDGNG